MLGNLPVNVRRKKHSKVETLNSRLENPKSKLASSNPKDETQNLNPVFLSAADSAFIHIERKEIPLAIACVTIFDGPIPFQEFLASVASRVREVPRYRQVVVVPPLGMGMPTWEDDPHFDARRHVFRMTVDPPGGQAQLEALVGRIFSRLLDRRKPLWEVYVIDGLKDGRGAIIWRLHHALADGISGTQLLEVFLDSTPEGAHAPRRIRPRSPQLPVETRPGGISGVVSSTLDSLIATERGLLGFAQALLGSPNQEGSKSLLAVLPEFLASVERLPFNKPCGEGRKFCWADFDMAEVKAIREAVGGRVNDVILAVVTRALARYVKLHGQTVVNRFVRIVCPVNLRKPGLQENLGNQISFFPVALPMDISDPVEMLRAVAARTEAMKNIGAAALVGLIGAAIARTPPPVQALFWGGLPELIFPLPILNMICTNLPGPPIPLYAVGRRMIACYPQVPTGYELGVNVAVASYDGKLFFGLIADAHAASDVTRLRDFLYVEFRELSRAAQKLTRASDKDTAPRRAPAAGGKRLPKQPRLAAKPSKLVPPRPEPQPANQATPHPDVEAAPVPKHLPATAETTNVA